MKFLVQAAVISLCAVVIASCGNSDSSPDPTTGSTLPPGETQTSEQGQAQTPKQEGAPTPEDDQGPVATVNGEDIPRAEFEEQLTQVRLSYEAQGLQFPVGEELARLRQQVVTRLVQQELVLQESEARGMTANEEEIEAEYQATASSFPDEDSFNQALETQGLDRDELRGLIADNIKITKLLDSVIEQAQLVPPTEEELRQLYDLAKQQQELPAFEEVRPQLEAQLQSQREDEVLQSFVRELEASGSVEIHLRS